MKIVEINSCHWGSTGGIMLNIAQTAREHGHEIYTFSEKRKKALPVQHQYFGSILENYLHRLISVLTGISGTGSVIGTYQLLRKLDQIHPDVLHLHNLHGWYINVPMLFRYIREKGIRTVWTLHDCWAFTAQCSHFVMEKCEKWKTGCYDCPRYRIYPYTYVDRTRRMWKLKKKWLTGIENLTIVTPSQWLADLVKQSYLREYEVNVIPNGIDLSVFCPTDSDFREKHGLQDKKIVLGVASGWTERKGLDVFVELSKRLSAMYQIVLVGTDDAVDNILPKEILSVHRTANQKELAAIYTTADVFVNPTREDTFPTVNMEAIACGTPVVTFRTGGSPEMLDGDCGIVTEQNDVDSLIAAIEACTRSIKTMEENCAEKRCGFDQYKRYAEYLQLYIQSR